MLLTINQLEKAIPPLPYKRLELLLPILNSTLRKYGIGNTYRVSHFLTQLIVESSYFRNVQYPDTGQQLGTDPSEDFRRYSGRGYIKIVGRSQYQAYKDYSGVDVIGFPHLVTAPKIAMDIAGWLWDKKELNAAADVNDLESITYLLVGAATQIRERQEIFQKLVNIVGWSGK